MDAFIKRSKRSSVTSDEQLKRTESKRSIDEETVEQHEPEHKKIKTENTRQIESLSNTERKSKETPDHFLKIEPKKSLQWKYIREENLDCDYTKFLTKSEADALLQKCEESFTYNTGRLAQVQVFGKWHDIPRKQVAFGDEGMTYTFSNNEVPARPWPPFLEHVRDRLCEVSGQMFNFVLINRYENGNDHMGEHRDDEADLVKTSPIASLSLGQERDFIFKHKDARGKNATRKIPPISLSLEHGSLLLMKYPTNNFWYHSLPKRKKALGIRINMTFRDFVKKK